MNKLKSLQKVGRGFVSYFKESSRIARASDQMNEAMYNENLITMSLRNQIDAVLEEFRKSDKPIEMVIVEIEEDARAHVTAAAKGLGCEIYPHVVPGQYIITYKEETI